MSMAELVGLLSPFVVGLTTRINTVADIKSFLHQSKLHSRVDSPVRGNSSENWSFDV